MLATRYCLVIYGELGPRYASAFPGMTVRPHDGQTEIFGPVTDPSHLKGCSTELPTRAPATQR